MTIEERAAQAVALKQGSCNCCQAVLCALADQTGLRPEQLLALGSGFGAGMGCMEATCGFQAACGATLCKDLKGRDNGKVLCPCDTCVRNAVLAYGEGVGTD